ncbi:TetR/AcrR family transcriptional regulator [Gulosibacter macacae]|uniref:TetR/AcrR family transcriptional regulator n=1 Tax=Gulosibacter macacae TaxID=2488791 RepID=A0A3P3VYI7_9MICO|nr:TetR/AcrR family transcriptional regulator [Gulosibacter macacae]RRJ85743.1 TetR/AcrR family transcriptional regulator [Gulosibacter macacae]
MTDPRIERTKESLRAAVLRLAAERPLSEISVSELTSAADVNRATFYSHFRNLDEVLTEALCADLDQRRDDDLARRRAGDLPPAELLDFAIESVFEHISKYDRVYRLSLDETSSPVWRTLRSSIRAGIRDVIDEQPNKVSGLNPSLAADFASSGLVGSIEGWMRLDDTSLEELRSTIRLSLPEWWRSLQ